MSTARRSVEVPGFSHGNQPIPAACRIGSFVVTGGIYGLCPESNMVPDDLERQATLMFSNLERILRAAGVTYGNVIKMNFWVRKDEYRGCINSLWIDAFPDAASRPARHTMRNEHMPANLLVQCDAMAIVGEEGSGGT